MEIKPKCENCGYEYRFTSVIPFELYDYEIISSFKNRPIIFVAAFDNYKEMEAAKPLNEWDDWSRRLHKEIQNNIAHFKCFQCNSLVENPYKGTKYDA